MVTVITMITGELDYSDVFGLSYDAINDTMLEEDIRNIQYPGTAKFVWVIFLVFIPILLSNYASKYIKLRMKIEVVILQFLIS